MLASDFQTSHQIMQVPRRLQNLCRELSLWGLTQISWGSIGLCGVLFVSQNDIRFRTLEAIVPSHSFAKNHSSPADYILLNFLLYVLISSSIANLLTQQMPRYRWRHSCCPDRATAELRRCELCALLHCSDALASPPGLLPSPQCLKAL